MSGENRSEMSTLSLLWYQLQEVGHIQCGLGGIPTLEDQSLHCFLNCVVCGIMLHYYHVDYFCAFKFYIGCYLLES
jgi:hypothetical protein